MAVQEGGTNIGVCGHGLENVCIFTMGRTNWPGKSGKDLLLHLPRIPRAPWGLGQDPAKQRELIWNSSLIKYQIITTIANLVSGASVATVSTYVSSLRSHQIISLTHHWFLLFLNTVRDVKNIWRILNTTASIWHKHMLRYLSLDIICSLWSSQFTSSYALRRLFAFRKRQCPRTNIQGIAVNLTDRHIFAGWLFGRHTGMVSIRSWSPSCARPTEALGLWKGTTAGLRSFL